MRLYLLFVAALIAVLSTWSHPAGAAPSLDCSGKPSDYNSDGDILKRACQDARLVALDRAISDGFASAITKARDPLLNAALRLEQNRRQMIPESADRADAEHADQALAFLAASLKRQQAILAAVARPTAPGIAGEWANSHATVKAEPIAADSYRLTITNTHVESYWSDVSVGTCVASVTVKRSADGWYESELTKAAKKDATPTRIIRQGPILALVLGTADRPDTCGQHEAITGPYFRLAATPEPANQPLPTPVLPSFDCATEKNSVDVCLDPELAGLDRDLSRAYTAALKRVSAETIPYLREDQRQWLKLKADMVEDELSPVSSKLLLPLDNFGGGRRLQVEWMKGRTAMLDAIEARRDGFVGDWMSYAAFARITPSTKGGLFLSAEKAGFYYHGGDCDYVAWAKVENGILAAAFQPTSDTPSAGRKTPAVWSDGRTLTLDADYPALEKANENVKNAPSIRPTYCTKNLAPDVRLFPVRVGAKGVTPTFDTLTAEDKAEKQIEDEEALWR